MSLSIFTDAQTIDSSSLQSKQKKTEVIKSDSLQQQIEKKDSTLIADLQIKIDKSNKDISTLSETDKNYFYYFIIVGGVALIGLVLSIITLIRLNSNRKITNSLKNLINSNKENDDNTLRKVDLANKNITEIKTQISEMVNKISDNYNTLNNTKIEISNMKNKYDAALNFKNEVNNSQRKENLFINETLKSTPVEEQPEIYNVEYFVDNGRIKFRRTNFSSPFYIEKQHNTYYLSINESIYANTYSDLIEKCFIISGINTGRYKNISPAICTFDNNSTWELIEKGKLETL
jgi:hypothetical protein